MTKTKKVAKHPAKQARLLTQLIDKKIDIRVSGLESTVSKMFKLFKKMKTVSSPQRILALEKEIHSLKEILSDFNVKNLEGDIFKKFNKIDRKIIKSVEDQGKSIENAEIEISAIKKSLEDFQTIEKEFINLDTKTLMREVESLKIKTHWLELELEKLNIRPLLDKLEEIDNRVNTLKLSQPTIIE